MGISDRIAEIELEMSRTQKNKATEHHLAGLKSKLAKLKSELTASNAKPSIAGQGWEVQKTGNARVCLVGFPSVGKSTFLSTITSTYSKQAEHEFTTVDCISGKFKYNGADIQVLDLPGIIEGAASNRGRGRQIISVAKTADLIVMMLDYRRRGDKEILMNELDKMGIKINKKRPDVTFSRSSQGININAITKLTKITPEIIKEVLKAYKIDNVNITIKDDITDEDLIDAISGSNAYIKCLFVYNKIDELSYEEFLNIDFTNSMPISCSKKWNIEELKKEIYKSLDFIRIYTKRKGEEPNFNEPLILKGSNSIKDLCFSLHKDFVINFKHAFVWGTSAKHSPQKVGFHHILEDEDVVQLFFNK
ncbi:hypothetical protein NUSPORA_01931 [Nucleospora cyclopteri]